MMAVLGSVALTRCTSAPQQLTTSAPQHLQLPQPLPTSKHLPSLCRNKLWIYNEQMTLHDKPRPFAKTYAKWVELTDGMAQQVATQETSKLKLKKNN